MLINNGIVSSNDLKIIQSLIPVKHSKARPKYSMQAKYITVHNTGNAGATGKQNADYVVSQNEYKSWHFTVGNNDVYQHLPISESAWHCGDGENGTGNRNSIGVEIAEVYGAEKTAVKFVAELMKETNIPIENIVPHKHWSGKNCPRLILPYWDSFIEDIKKEIEGEKVEVRYKKYSDRIHELRGEVKDLFVKIVNKSNRAIEEPYCVNGTYFWHTDKPNIKYSTSILYADGKIYQAAANHLPYPQSVYIVYKDNTVEMKLIKYLSELDLDKIKLVIGGVGIRNTLDSTFRYSPVSEGFSGVYADVLRRSNKTLIGYNKRLNKQSLLVLKNVTMAEVISIISDNSTGEAYDICLMVDGGGSTTLNNETDMVVYGDGRIIHNIIMFGR